VKLAVRGLLVLAVAALATQAGAAARRPHTTVDAGFFWTPKVGLIGVGFCEPWNHKCRAGAVELTTDGGKTYQVIFRTTRPVTDVQAVGARGAIARLGRYRAYRTLDRGRHWSRVRTLEGASFANARVALGFRRVFGPRFAKLLRTGDGGRTWRRVRTPTHCQAERPLLDLVTPRLGWLVCGGPGGAGPFESKAVFRTPDGGRTWRLLESVQADGRAARHGLSPAGLPDGISFTRGGFGVMWGNGVLDVSRDGGTTWKAHLRLAQYNVDFPLGGSAFGNGVARVFEWHSGGRTPSSRLIETRDFGRRWRIVRVWR
jgi:hypothetical protein